MEKIDLLTADMRAVIDDLKTGDITPEEASDRADEIEIEYEALVGAFDEAMIELDYLVAGKTNLANNIDNDKGWYNR